MATGLALRLVGLVSVWACVACGADALDPDQSPGELGNGAFRYECFDTEDAACPDGLTAEEFPDSVAVGSRFQISYEEFDPSGPTSAFKIEAASNVFVKRLDKGFEGISGGFAGLFARRTSDSTIIDIIHLRVADIAELELRTDDNKPLRVAMRVGETQSVRTRTYDKSGNKLAGANDFYWKVTGDKAVALEFASPSAVMDITAAQVGTSELSVTVGEVENLYTITVEEAAQ